MLPGQCIQLSTDGLGLYLPVVDSLWRDGIDYAQIVKEYGNADTRTTVTHPLCASRFRSVRSLAIPSRIW